MHVFSWHILKVSSSSIIISVRTLNLVFLRTLKCSLSCYSTGNSSFQFLSASADVKSLTRCAAEDIKSTPSFLLLLPLSLLPLAFFFWCHCLHCDRWLRQMHRQKGITLTVLSEDKFVYTRWTDTPPNKNTLAHHSPIVAWHAEHTAIISRIASRAYAFWQNLERTHAHTHTHIYSMKAYEFRRCGGLLYFKKHNIKIDDS